MDLLTHLLHYFFFCCSTIIFHHTSLFISLFYPLSLSSHFFLCHKWWSFTFQCMDDRHIPLHSYLMDIGSEILSWEGHLVRESSSTSLFERISISLCILSGARLLIFRVCASKKNKNKNKCIYVCIQCHPSLRLLYWVSCLWKFVCELSGVFHLLVSISLCILCMIDEWTFPRDFELLSSPSLHTLVIWPFSMTWFQWISAHSFSFNLFVSLMVFHSPYLHCSLFISIYIPCSIFSTHHSYTSHQQFNILHFFSFITDIFILDFFFLTDIFILDVLGSMAYVTLYTYCILYMRVWGFIIGIIEVSIHIFTFLP